MLALMQDKPYAFFGHSLGGRLALLLAQTCIANAMAPPLQLIVSATTSQNEVKHAHILRFTRDALIDFLCQSGLISNAVGNDRQLMDFYLPIIRADLLLASEIILPRATQLPIPLAFFHGDDDPWVDSQDLADWRSLATGGFHAEKFTGGHMFLHQQRNAVINAIHRLLA